MRTHNRFVLLLVLAIAAATRVVAAPGNDAPRPNIVYIMADDQGWGDVGFHGSDIRTPVLDRLAESGACLEAFYAQPMCTPSRAALMTGRYPFRYGLQTAVIPSASTYGLATDERLLPEILGAAGYATTIVGKWHLGHGDRKYWPRQRGFDRAYGPVLGEIDYFTHRAHGTTDWYRDDRLVEEEGYATTLLGDEAVSVIEGHDPGRPLFLYLAFTAPHAPYQAPQEYLDSYAGIVDQSRRAYAAMITAMDAQIGRVVDALERRGLRGNTLIVFQSDNGGPRSARFTGEIDMSKSTIPADNGPYRDGKGSLYEGGTRVVALANWTGRIVPGTVVNEPLHVVDMMPTLAGLAGAGLDGCKPLDGLDAWEAIAGGAASPRDEVVYNVGPFLASVRQGDWKLLWQTALPSRVELFDLANDPYEQTDVAAAQPQKVAALQRRIEELARESVAPLFLADALGATRHVLFGSVATPAEQEDLVEQP